MSVASPPNYDGFMRWILRCNEGSGQQQQLVPLLVGQEYVGYLLQEFAEKLCSFAVFAWKQSNDGRVVELSSDLKTCEQRTAAVAPVLAALRDEGIIRGWRDELYPVVASFHSPPALLVERAAAVHLGVKAYGVHMNGFVTTPDGLKLWVATRSKSKPTFPGQLDHLAAGGQPHGISCLANMVKECWEEAGIPADLAKRGLVPVGAVSYAGMQAEGLKRDVLFMYDLQLPESFMPVAQDGEVEQFECLSVEEVAKLVETTDAFKYNCNLVIISFLIRHGCLVPDVAGYAELVQGLCQGDCR